MQKVLSFAVLILAIVLFQASGALANKAESAIEGPAMAAKGSEVILRITVTHNANTATHYVEWLKATANGKEVARWDYTKDNRPEGAAFVKEVKVKVMEDTEIISESSCNNHGSKGPAKHKITVK